MFTCRALLSGISVPKTMMGLRLRCRYSSLLQVVAIGVCYRQEVTSST